MELTEERYAKLSEDGNKLLYRIAREKGVKNYDRFTNAGYKGLYNGETANGIAKSKGYEL